MRIFQKLFNRAKQEDGSYKLSSFWTAADTVEFDDGETLEECKENMTTALSQKGDGLYYDNSTKMLYLLSGEQQISGVELQSGGSGEILGDVTNVSVVPTEHTVTIKWTDPNDGQSIEWGGTTVIIQEGHRPVDFLDGTVVVDETTKNQYQSTGYVVSNLKQNTTYWFRFFPYTTEGQIRVGMAVVVNTLSDGTVADEFPTVSGTYTYNGNSQQVVLNDFDATKMVVTDGGFGTNAGDYDCVVSLKTGYAWPDSSTDPLHLAWTIQRGVIEQTPSQSGETTYTGTTREPSWSNYDSNKLVISGDTNGVNAGTYTAIFTPTSNYKWSDESVTGRNVQWTIQKATISTVPSQSGTLEYTGFTVTPTWSNYDSTKMTISGQTSGVQAGTYTAIFTPTSNYKWSDGTTGGKEVTWTISNSGISIVPSQNGTLTYNGNTQSPTWNDYDSTKLTVSGNSGRDAGSYTATFTPKSGYKWSDGTTGGKNATWVIDKQTISSVPTVKTSPTYSGSSQSPTWNNYDSSKLTIGGTYSATNAGTYTATFTPKANYMWSDGTSTAKSVSWTMNKAAGTLTLSKSSTSISSGSTDTVTASNYQGTLSVSTSNSSIATASVSGNTITITGIASGTCSITITSGSTTNYNSISKTVSVNIVQSLKKSLPYKFDRGKAIVHNNELYLLGGVDAYSSLNNCYKYNSNNNTWNYVDALLYKFYSGYGFENPQSGSNNHLMIVSSNDVSSENTKAASYFGDSTNKWISKFTISDTYKYLGGYGASVLFNNYIYIIVPKTQTSTAGHTGIFKMNSTTITKVCDLPRELNEGNTVAFVYNNIIHFFFGNHHYTFNGTTASQLSDLSIKSYNRDTCVLYNNEYYAITYKNSEPIGKLSKWNGSDWTEVADMPYKSIGGNLIVYNNKIHFLGGYYDDTGYYHCVWNGSTWDSI